MDLYTLTDAELNLYVTSIVEAYTNEYYATTDMAPDVPVGSSSFAYRKLQRSGAVQSSVVGEYGEGIPFGQSSEWEKLKTEDHFRIGLIPDAVRLLGREAAIDLASELADGIGEEFKREANVDFANWITKTSNFTNHGIPGTKWDAPNGDPAKDISAKILTISTIVGRAPNGLGMTPDVFREIATNHARSVDGNQATASKQAVLNYIAADALTTLAICDVDNGKGVNAYGTKNLWLFYNAPTASRVSPSFASTFRFKKGSYTKTAVINSPAGQALYAHSNYLTHVRNEKACYYFHGVLT